MSFKNITTKIKTTNYKEFFINHVEKFLVAFAAMFVVYCLVNTNWSFEKRKPEALAADVAAAKTQYEQKNWSPEERAAFEANSNLDSKIQKILYPIAVHKYGFSTDMDWPILDERKPATEAEYLPVRALAANSGRTLLNLIDRNKVEQIEKTETELVNSTGANFDEAQKEIMAQFGITPEAYARQLEAERLAREEEKQAPGQRGRRGSRNFADSKDDRELNREERGRGRRQLGNLIRQSASVAEPHRFVSVTGVFPVRQQKLELLKSMNSTSMAQTVMNIDSLFYDFKIERQEAQPGDDPWSSEWREVSRPVTEDILRRSSGFAPENVNQFVTNSIFTMPMPARMRGKWGRYATHPLIENYVLSDEEVKQQVKIVNEMVEEELARKQAEKQIEEQGPGGFSNFLYDVRGFQNQSSGSFLDQLLQESPDDREKKIIEKLKSAASAQNNLLLFRFIDFSVEPGQIYRYRVKLVFRNPNYKKEQYKVESPEVAEGEFRESPWSNPTLPVAVVDDLQYYIAKDPLEVNGRWGTSVEAFQWLEEFGTLINEKITLKLGDFVADQKRTEVVKPSEQKKEKEAVQFKSNEMLLALDSTIELDPSLHTDLELPNSTGRDLPGMPTIGLFTNPNGVLKVKDTIADQAIETQLENTVKFERLSYDSESALGSQGSGGGSRRDDDEDDDDRRGFNPTRRGGRR